MSAGLASKFQEEEDMKAPIKSFVHAITDQDYQEVFDLYPTSDFEEEAKNYKARKTDSDPDAPVHYFRVSRIFRDILFTCSSIDFGYEITKQSKAVDPSFPGIRIYNLNQTMFTPFLKLSGMPYIGACHGSDMAYILNGVLPDGAISKPDKRLSESMAASFINFAYTGDPTNTHDDQGF